MFSRTTMQLSTTIPTANARPASEMTLIERPEADITRKVATTEMGIETATTNVPLADLRKRSNTAIARIPPITMFDLTRPNDEWM
jgi:hypothetical protein